MNESTAAQEWSAVVRIADVSAERRQLTVSAAAIWHARDVIASKRRALSATDAEHEHSVRALADTYQALERVTHERDKFQAMAGANGLAGLEVGRENDALRAAVERLTSAIRWALGYDEGPPDFEEPEDANKRRYWWREELRRRAALQEATP